MGGLGGEVEGREREGGEEAEAEAEGGRRSGWGKVEGLRLYDVADTCKKRVA